MAGGISTQDQQALLKALSSPSPNYSGPIGEPSYPSGILSSGAYAPWAGIGDFQPTPMFQMQGPQVSYSNPNTGFGRYMDQLKAAEEAAAAAEAIRNNNNTTNAYNDSGSHGENMGDISNTDLSNDINDFFGFPGDADVPTGDPEGYDPDY